MWRSWEWRARGSCNEWYRIAPNEPMWSCRSPLGGTRPNSYQRLLDVLNLLTDTLRGTPHSGQGTSPQGEFWGGRRELAVQTEVAVSMASLLRHSHLFSERGTRGKTKSRQASRCPQDPIYVQSKGTGRRRGRATNRRPRPKLFPAPRLGTRLDGAGANRLTRFEPPSDLGRRGRRPAPFCRWAPVGLARKEKRCKTGELSQCKSNRIFWTIIMTRNTGTNQTWGFAELVRGAEAGKQDRGEAATSAGCAGKLVGPSRAAQWRGVVFESGRHLDEGFAKGLSETIRYRPQRTPYPVPRSPYRCTVLWCGCRGARMWCRGAG